MSARTSPRGGGGATGHAFPPGAWLGLLGGGQLGRMFCMAAQSLGFRVLVLDPGDRQPRRQRRRPASRRRLSRSACARGAARALPRPRRPNSRTCRPRRWNSWRARARDARRGERGDRAGPHQREDVPRRQWLRRCARTSASTRQRRRGSSTTIEPGPGLRRPLLAHRRNILTAIFSAGLRARWRRCCQRNSRGRSIRSPISSSRSTCARAASRKRSRHRWPVFQRHGADADAGDAAARSTEHRHSGGRGRLHDRRFVRDPGRRRRAGGSAARALPGARRPRRRDVADGSRER